MAELDWISDGKKFLAQEAAFRPLIEKHSVPLRALPRVDLFQALGHAIVNQQISGYAADAIYGRLAALFPRKRLDPAKLLEFPDDTLRRAGLSRNKVRFLKDLAQYAVQRRLPSGRELAQLNDEEILARLVPIHGIGPWTVQMLLIFKLGRPDVFPASDIGIQNGFQKLFRRRTRPSVDALERYSRRWKPYRTLAAWYLWRASEDLAFNPVQGDLLWTKSKSSV